jgi:hypothetical protein
VVLDYIRPDGVYIIYIYIHIYVYIYIYTYTHTNIYISIVVLDYDLIVCMYIYISYKYIFIYIFILYIYTYTCNIYILIRMNIYNSGTRLRPGRLRPPLFPLQSNMLFLQFISSIIFKNWSTKKIKSKYNRHRSKK